MTPTLGTSRRRLAALLLVCVAVALAGCGGWGTDGPANDSDASNTSSDDLEDEQNDDSSNVDSDGSDATNESDAIADGEESDDGSPDDGDSVDDPSGTDASDGEDTSDGSEDESEERTDEDTESEPGADDSETDTDETPDNESPSEQPPADENGDENTSDENASDDSETYTLTVEAEGPVTIERLSDGATTTREATDGTVEFTVLEDDYEVRAEQEEYVDPMLSIGVAEDRTITLQRGGSITYTVVDAETGDPIEGAEISGMCDLWYSSGDASISGESNASGVIEADTLIPTTCRYDTQITADGYEPASLGEISVPEDDGTTVELQPEDSESAAALALGGVDGTASIVRA